MFQEVWAVLYGWSLVCVIGEMTEEEVDVRDQVWRTLTQVSPNSFMYIRNTGDLGWV